MGGIYDRAAPRHYGIEVLMYPVCWQIWHTRFDWRMCVNPNGLKEP